MAPAVPARDVVRRSGDEMSGGTYAGNSTLSVLAAVKKAEQRKIAGRIRTVLPNFRGTEGKFRKRIDIPGFCDKINNTA